jgi:choline dehydrogenase-like flavoprotein
MPAKRYVVELAAEERQYLTKSAQAAARYRGDGRRPTGQAALERSKTEDERGPQAAGETDSGLKTWAIAKPITIHPWGGACLGAGPDRGVVDHRGEVYGNPGLFVADGAALPAAPGTPPSLAIAAWAHDVADRLAKWAS